MHVPRHLLVEVLYILCGHDANAAQIGLIKVNAVVYKSSCCQIKTAGLLTSGMLSVTQSPATKPVSSVNHSLRCSLGHSVTRSLTHPPTHPLAH